MRKRLLFCAALLIAATAAQAADFDKRFEEIAAAKGQGSDSERLKRLFDLAWEHQIQEVPEMATYLGYPGRHDRWSDQSPEAVKRREATTDKVLLALRSIDRARLTPSEQVLYDLAQRSLEREVEARRFPGEYLQISQVGGVHQDATQLLALMPGRTVEDYENILARLRGLPAVIDQTIAWLEKGLAAGVTPPRITLRDVPDQVKSLIVDDALQSPMLTAFNKFPESVRPEERQRLSREAVRAFGEQVAPALRKLHRYLTETYIPGTRETIAMTALPDGEAWYAFNVRGQTTTDLTPKQIHELGLSEVQRIRTEMDKVIASTGFKGSFEEFIQFLRTDPRFFFDKPEDLVAEYREIAKRADPELAHLFGKLPRLPYGVKPIPSYAEKSQTTAYYDGGSLAAGRPGTYYVNTYDLKSRPKWEMEALTLHESVPGHHLQVALAQEMEGVPEWRKHDGYTAFAEGWALYAESLGTEMGFYQDPYSKFGQLTYEMWRAVRLVVDTGMHSMGWTRQQAIDYFKANAAKTEHDIVVEVDRYIVWPGQALAYKIGELKIKELRALAEKELGPKFDVRAFHDQVLGNGSLPLNLLEKNVRAWIRLPAP
ncbi:MAG TPA: DUF885 domain-containing protein [Thermoanaerobaculia bacterium]